MSTLMNLIRDIFVNKGKNSFSPDNTYADLRKLIESCNTLLAQGELGQAENAYNMAVNLYPENQELVPLKTEVEFAKCISAATERFPGPSYLEWLEWFHATLKPSNYLEIGVESGQSIQLARAPTRSVGVDPAIQIVHPQENWVKLFKLTSDDFFAFRDVKDVFGSDTIDMAFIDGLHTFDQALKDFINVERFSNNKTVVLFHDIFPVTSTTAKRNRETRFQIGDTWKVVLILSRLRPDLKLFTIPTFPSGLAVVTNLNAGSTILRDKYDSIVQDTMELDLDEYMPDIERHLHAVRNNQGAIKKLLPFRADS